MMGKQISWFGGCEGVRVVKKRNRGWCGQAIQRVIFFAYFLHSLIMGGYLSRNLIDISRVNLCEIVCLWGHKHASGETLKLLHW